MSIHQDFAGLFFLVFGLWKFGLPETFLYYYSALYNDGGKGSSRGLPARVSDFLNGWGTAMHHSAVTVFCVALLAGVVQPTPAAISCALPPLMQHWFSLMHYVNPTFHITVELSLEVWFEWTIFSVYHEVAMDHWCLPLCAVGLLVAHWMYLLAAALELVFGSGNIEDDVISHMDSEQLSSHFCGGSHTVKLVDFDDDCEEALSVTWLQELVKAHATGELPPVAEISHHQCHRHSFPNDHHVRFAGDVMEGSELMPEVEV